MDFRPIRPTCFSSRWSWTCSNHRKGNGFPRTLCFIDLIGSASRVATTRTKTFEYYHPQTLPRLSRPCRAILCDPELSTKEQRGAPVRAAISCILSVCWSLSSSSSLAPSRCRAFYKKDNNLT
jgi:hypothetical protein